MDKYQITIDTFNRLADAYQDKYMDFDFYWDTYDTFCGLVTREGAAILEVACGPGNITKYLLDKRPDFKIEGIDLAPNMVKLALANNPAASFQVMDSRKMTAIGRQFDAIMCGFCFPYLSKKDIAKFFVDARSLLKTGGILYVSTMEGDDEKSGFQTSGAGDKVYIYYHQFEYINHHLKLNGFKTIEVKRKAFPEDKGLPATDLFVFAQAC